METSNSKVNWSNIIPIILILGIIPITVHLKIFKMDNEFYKSYNLTTNYDFYSYYKMLLFSAFSAIALCITVIKYIVGDVNIKKNRTNIFILLFSVMMFLSYLVSKNKNIALLGFYDRYEGVIMLLAYMFILFYTINEINNEKEIMAISYALVFCSLIIGIIGIFQAFGYDIFQTAFGKQLMTFGVKDINIKNVTNTLEKNSVYATLYHTDYVGSFISILFPFFVSLALLLKENKYKLLFGIMSILMFICLVGSKSRAGIFGIIMSTIIFAFLNRSYILKRWKYVVTFTISIMIFLIIMNKVTSGALFMKLFTINIDKRISINSAHIDNISINKNMISIYADNDILNVTFDENGLKFENNLNQPVPAKVIDSKILLDYDKYKNYNFQRIISGNNNYLVSYIGNVKLVFVLTDQGVKFLNSNNQATDIHGFKSFGFAGKEQLGSGRGYIWSRSLPLLKNTLLVGHGPDTFALYFPQEDYIGKIKTYGTIGMFVDKPHNFYLQTALNTGVLSLIALLGIFVPYIIQSFKLYFSQQYFDTYSIYGVSIFLGIIGYLTAAFFNDSVVSVAPVFWVLLGVGISINLKLLNDKKTVLKHK